MENFKILLPYRVKGMTTDEQTIAIKRIVAYVQCCSAIVNDLLETDILDENGTIVEHVYALACYGDTNNKMLRRIFGNEMKDSEGRVLFS